MLTLRDAHVRTAALARAVMIAPIVSIMMAPTIWPPRMIRFRSRAGYRIREAPIAVPPHACAKQPAHGAGDRARVKRQATGVGPVPCALSARAPGTR